MEKGFINSFSHNCGFSSCSRTCLPNTQVWITSLLFSQSFMKKVANWVSNNSTDTCPWEMRQPSHLGMQHKCVMHSCYVRTQNIKKYCRVKIIKSVIFPVSLFLHDSGFFFLTAVCGSKEYNGCWVQLSATVFIMLRHQQFYPSFLLHCQGHCQHSDKGKCLGITMKIVVTLQTCWKGVRDAQGPVPTLKGY